MVWLHVCQSTGYIHPIYYTVRKLIRYYGSYICICTVCVRRDSHAAVVFVVETVVRGYSVYQIVLDAVVSEDLTCQRKPDNSRIPFLGSPLQEVMGHVPKLDLATLSSSTCKKFRGVKSFTLEDLLDHVHVWLFLAN